MFGTSEIERRFSGLTEKAIGLLKGDYRTKGISEKNLHDMLLQSSLAGVEGIMSGLSGELSRIIRSDSESKDAEIGRAFQLGLSSVTRLLGVKSVKQGTASWVSYATTGLPMPQKARDIPPGWEGVLGGAAAEEAEEKSNEPGEYFWITKARERVAAGASTDRDKYLAEARTLMGSEPDEEVVQEVIDLAAELWPGKSRKDLAEMIQFKGG